MEKLEQRLAEEREKEKKKAEAEKAKKPAEEKPKLKVLTGGAADLTPAPEIAVLKKKRGGDLAGIRVANRTLMTLILLILGLAGYEIWANVVGSGRPFGLSQPDVGDLPGLPTDDVQLPTSEQVREAYAKKEIFRYIPVTTTKKTTGTDPNIPPVGDLKYMGYSWLEGGGVQAMIVDKKDNNRMHFLKEGATVLIGQQQFEVEKIDVNGNRVILKRGNERIVVN